LLIAGTYNSAYLAASTLELTSFLLLSRLRDVADSGIDSALSALSPVADLGGGGVGRLPLSKQGAVQGRIAHPDQIWVDFLNTIFSHK